MVAALAAGSAARAQTSNSRDAAGSSALDTLVREGLAGNPAVLAARDHWQALKRSPVQIRTLPDPQVQLQEFTVGSPRPGAGYETSDFYYSGFAVTQDLPGIGADVMKPIAAPIVRGMITSTIHVLILVPVLFVIMKERALKLYDAA